MQATLDGRPGAAYVDVPSDVLFAEASSSDIPSIGEVAPADHSRPLPALQRAQASSSSVEKAIKLLSKAQRQESQMSQHVQQHEAFSP